MKTKIAVIPFLLLLALFFWGCDVSVNRSIHIADGESSHGLSSVNGSIHIGSRCRIDGGSHTVNGSISVGDDSRVRGLETVNGRIHLEANVDVDGDAGTVNGAIECGGGSKIHGSVSTVNGRIEMSNTEVDGEVSTVNGDVLLREKSIVRGDIVIKGRHGGFFDHHHLDIRISGGSWVEGGIKVHGEDIEVKVYLSADSTVKGEIQNAQVIKE